MKGVVFDLFQEVVSRGHGEHVWDDLLDAAQLEGAYTSLGSYPDEDFRRLVEAASSALEMDAPDLVRWFGRNALPLLASRYPQFFTPHQSARAFVLTLNDIIHPEVRKLYPGADVPTFEFEDSASGALIMAYTSPRKLCAFAEGLIEGAASFYGETAAIEQPTCMNRDDPKCVLRISFSRARAAP